MAAQSLTIAAWACHGQRVGPALVGTGGDATAGSGGSAVAGGSASGAGGTSGAGAAPGSGGLAAGSGGASGASGSSSGGGSSGTGGAGITGGTGGTTSGTGGSITGGTGGSITGGTGGTTGGTGGSITGGTGGTTGGTGGSITGGTGGSITGGTGGSITGGTGGTTGGTGGTTGGTGGTTCTQDGLIRKTCPNTEVCSAGSWIKYTELACNACSIVTCPASTPDCCSGFRTNAFTAGTFVPNPSAITAFSTSATQVTATFRFGQAYEIGSIDLLLPVELPINSLFFEYTYSGNVYVDFSMENGTGQSGATYWDDGYGNVDLTAPISCFPQQTICPATGNQVNIRLRPYGSGSASLTVTAIVLGT